MASPFSVSEYRDGHRNASAPLGSIPSIDEEGEVDVSATVSGRTLRSEERASGQSDASGSFGRPSSYDENLSDHDSVHRRNMSRGQSTGFRGPADDGDDHEDAIRRVSPFAWISEAVEPVEDLDSVKCLKDAPLKTVGSAGVESSQVQNLGGVVLPSPHAGWDHEEDNGQEETKGTGLMEERNNMDRDDMEPRASSMEEIAAVLSRIVSGNVGVVAEQQGGLDVDLLSSSMHDLLSFQDAISRREDSNLSDYVSLVSEGGTPQLMEAQEYVPGLDVRANRALFHERFEENVTAILAQLEERLEAQSTGKGQRIPFGMVAVKETVGGKERSLPWKCERTPWPRIYSDNVDVEDEWLILPPAEPVVGDDDEKAVSVDFSGVVSPPVGPSPSARGSPLADPCFSAPSSTFPNCGRLKLQRVIGQGSFGQVYKGLCLDSGMVVAIKFVKGTGDSLKIFIREGELGVMMNHPNIVKTMTYRISEGKSCKNLLQDLGFGLETFESAFVGGGSLSAQVEFLMEYCDLGKLTDHIYNEGGLYAYIKDVLRTSSASDDDGVDDLNGDVDDGKETDTSDLEVPSKVDVIAMLTLDIICGLIYLDSLGVVHGDLSGNNIMLSTDPTSPIGVCAKIADFGHASLSGENIHLFSAAGTISHMPMEFLQEGKRSTCSDLYSLAVTVHEMWTEKQYWEGLNTMQIIFKITQCSQDVTISNSIPDDLRRVLVLCLHNNSTRISLTEAFTLFAGLVRPEFLIRQLKRY